MLSLKDIHRNINKLTFLYTALGAFDKAYDKDGRSWNKYIEWSKLTHLTEVVSLDKMLNENLFEPDYDNPEDWNFIHTDGIYQTGFFTTAEYVLSKTKSTARFNFLKLVLRPDQECKNIKVDDYEFMGYELLDHEYGNSALTNCGGFDETISPMDLNSFGLIDDYEKACDIRKRLLENYPEEHHANTNIIAIWRHQTIGKII